MNEMQYYVGSRGARGVTLHMLASIMAISLGMSHSVFAISGQAYMDRFHTYTEWCQHLPRTPDPEFLAFIDKPTPLTQKLREKWLYQLAYNKDWALFTQYYPGSTDTNLQCYALTALYNQGKHQQALESSKKLWLNGGSQPIACNGLFTALLDQNEISDTLIQQRLALALANNNLSLARYLLKQYKPARIKDADILSAIAQNPKRIMQLDSGQVHGEFYLYGLKQIVPRNIDEAIRIFESPHAQRVMNIAQKQAFLANIALYKAMRNQPDTDQWFARVRPEWYNETLLEWEVRYALIHHHWHKVIYLISKSQNKHGPNNQYWMARALAALGESQMAKELYQQLAEKRNYYGFLASLRLNKHPSFENEPTTRNTQKLAAYKPITDQIRDLYISHQTQQASRLLNDFISELPKNEKSALASWVGNDLNWHDKAIFLSTNDDLNNQLTLRFPLAHREVVRAYSKNYQIPQELIYAVIRQESLFHDDIVSSAGANGLMQVMPGTAHLVAKRAKIYYTNKEQLFSPQKNIHIGTAYLQLLANQYHQHPVLMMAAYNAGPRQVNLWLKSHEPKEIDIWIETLPWRETRNYLKNIISFYAVYQYRMHEKLSLDAFMQPL